MPNAEAPRNSRAEMTSEGELHDTFRSWFTTSFGMRLGEPERVLFAKLERLVHTQPAWRGFHVAPVGKLEFYGFTPQRRRV